MSVDPISPVSGLGALSAVGPGLPVPPVSPVSPGDEALAALEAEATRARPVPPDPAVAAALSSAVAEAAAGQDGLAPLFADLSRAAQAPSLPADVRAKIIEVLQTQAPLSAGVTGQDIRSATETSGLFLEANLLAALQGAATGARLSPDAIAGDVKAQLLQLVALLSLSLGEDGPSPAPAERRSGARPPPPVRGGALRGERPAAPSIEARSDRATLLDRLLGDTRAALSRISLSQFASTPRAGDTATWRFEIPVATPGGQGFAEVEIHRDGQGTDENGHGGGGAAPSWRVRFALDIAPTGPLGAEIAVREAALKTTLWVTDAAARAAMAAQVGALETALRAEGWPNAVVRLTGSPPDAPAPRSGALVDRSA